MRPSLLFLASPLPRESEVLARAHPPGSGRASSRSHGLRWHAACGAGLPMQAGAVPRRWPRGDCGVLPVDASSLIAALDQGAPDDCLLLGRSCVGRWLLHGVPRAVS